MEALRLRDYTQSFWSLKVLRIFYYERNKVFRLSCVSRKEDDLDELQQTFTMELKWPLSPAFLVQIILSIRIHQDVQKSVLLTTKHSSKTINHLECCSPMTMALHFQTIRNLGQRKEKHQKMKSLPLKAPAMTVINPWKFCILLMEL